MQSKTHGKRNKNLFLYAFIFCRRIGKGSLFPKARNRVVLLLDSVQIVTGVVQSRPLLCLFRKAAVSQADKSSAKIRICFRNGPDIIRGILFEHSGKIVAQYAACVVSFAGEHKQGTAVFKREWDDLRISLSHATGAKSAVEYTAMRMSPAPVVSSRLYSRAPSGEKHIFPS